MALGYVPLGISNEHPSGNDRPVDCAQPLAHDLVPLAPSSARIEPVVDRDVESARRCIRFNLVRQRGGDQKILWHAPREPVP